jgi:hypothetical protein
MYRPYNFILISLTAALALIVLAVGVRLEELAGDVTRLGGYSENDFGWNGEERVFLPPLAEVGDAKRSYDIIVLGDSFSSRTSPDRQTPPGGYWTDFLAGGTRSTVGVFATDPPQIESFLKEGAFQTFPPKLLILEIVERQLKGKLASSGNTCGGNPADSSLQGSRLALKNLFSGRDAIPLSRQRKSRSGWRENLPDETLDYLFKNTVRSIAGYNPTSVLRVPLSRPIMFTSRRPSDLLVLQDDMEKAHWSKADWEAIRCRLLSVQQAVESNGKTRFLLIVSPDKSSAYSKYVPSQYRFANSQEILAGTKNLHFLRLDLPLVAAISAGKRDVYLPNDSHWSSLGSELVAKEVAKYLQSQ